MFIWTSDMLMRRAQVLLASLWASGRASGFGLKTPLSNGQYYKGFANLLDLLYIITNTVSTLYRDSDMYFGLKVFVNLYMFESKLNRRILSNAISEGCVSKLVGRVSKET